MNQNNKSVLCLQINLQHCKVASLNLSQVLVELDIDIALIQEPYAITNKFNNELLMPNIPSNYTVYHNLNKEHAFGAIILAKKSLKAINIAVPNTNNCVGVQLNKYPSFNFFSVYCRPSLSLDYFLNLIKSSPNLERSVIGMDSNAKNNLWNSKSTDKRGEYLESFTDHNKLNIVNVPVSKLEYIPQKTAMVDVTLRGDGINISNWHFPNEDSHSDHPIILFQVALTQP